MRSRVHPLLHVRFQTETWEKKACHIEFILGHTDTYLATSQLHSSVETDGLQPVHYSGAEQMAFSLEVEVRFINGKGLMNSKDIDHMMVIMIQMISSFCFLCLSKVCVLA